VLGTWLPIGSALATAGLSAWACRRRQPGDAAFGLFVCAALMTSPLSLDYHFTAALLPIGLLLAIVARSPSPPAAIVLLAATAAIGADLPYRSPNLAAGAWALLAYPKLYGALLLWALTLHFMRREPAPCPAAPRAQAAPA
jgi:hypothetical protein